MGETEPKRQRRIALLLEYEGTRLAGSQVQADAPTIQGELEAAILKTTAEAARAAFAGRTDAGVHALGQVAAFTTETELDVATLTRALNARLPRDIAVLAAADVDPGFDPRRYATRRHYRYLIGNRAVRPTVGRNLVWHVPLPLDLAAMADAAPRLLGLRDFAAFASPLEDRAAPTIRRLDSFEVRREGARVIVDVVANAFLPHQVRRMVGALAHVGLGKMTPAGYGDLLRGPPSAAVPAAPAQGLYLVRVEYPGGTIDWLRRRDESITGSA